MPVAIGLDGSIAPGVFCYAGKFIAQLPPVRIKAYEVRCGIFYVLELPLRGLEQFFAAIIPQA
jgi:hypothetical protein